MSIYVGFRCFIHRKYRYLPPDHHPCLASGQFACQYRTRYAVATTLRCVFMTALTTTLKMSLLSFGIWCKCAGRYSCNNKGVAPLNYNFHSLP